MAATPGVGSAIFTGPKPVMPILTFDYSGASLLQVAMCRALHTKLSHDKFAALGLPKVAVSSIISSNILIHPTRAQNVTSTIPLTPNAVRVYLLHGS